MIVLNVAMTSTRTVSASYLTDISAMNAPANWQSSGDALGEIGTGQDRTRQDSVKCSTTWRACCMAII